MNIAVGSAFRNSAGPHLSRYAIQLQSFIDYVGKRGHSVRWIATEGDSVDNTRIEIQRVARQLPVELSLAIREHGQRWFGSTEEPERMKALSFVGNGILESVHGSDDILVYVESDLIWKPDMICRLIDRDVDVISPMPFAGEAFYDIWAFRKNGIRFSPFEPYHPELQNHGSLTEVDSVGSCLVMKGYIARECRIRNDNALVGLCDDIREKGYKIYVDAQERIYHPA